MLSSRTATIVLIVVTGVWAASVFIPLWAPQFNSAPISTVFMTVVGGMLGVEVASSRKARKDEPEKPEKLDKADAEKTP